MTDEPVKRKKFEIPEKFLNHLSSLQNQEAADEIRGLCKQVEELVEKLGISEEYFSFVTDGDLAIPWEKYWAVDRRATKSVGYLLVTRETVSDAVHRVHPSSCPGHSSEPPETTCILLWTTWSPASGFRSGVYCSTRITWKTNHLKK